MIILQMNFKKPGQKARNLFSIYTRRWEVFLYCYKKLSGIFREQGIRNEWSSGIAIFKKNCIRLIVHFCEKTVWIKLIGIVSSLLILYSVTYNLIIKYLILGTVWYPKLYEHFLSFLYLTAILRWLGGTN